MKDYDGPAYQGRRLKQLNTASTNKHESLHQHSQSRNTKTNSTTKLSSKKWNLRQSRSSHTSNYSIPYRTQSNETSRAFESDGMMRESHSDSRLQRDNASTRYHYRPSMDTERALSDKSFNEMNNHIEPQSKKKYYVKSERSNYQPSYDNVNNEDSIAHTPTRVEDNTQPDSPTSDMAEYSMTEPSEQPSLDATSDMSRQEAIKIIERLEKSADTFLLFED